MFCGIMLLLWGGAVLSATLLFREAGEQSVYLVPFHQIRVYLSGGNPEILRMLWMNTLLFVPLGIFLPELLLVKWSRRRKLLFVLAAGLALSTFIEVSQWYWQLGQAETDDVLANLIGAGIGYGFWWTSSKLEYLWKKDKNGS